jgi:hypothetical protein
LRSRGDRFEYLIRGEATADGMRCSAAMAAFLHRLAPAPRRQPRRSLPALRPPSCADGSGGHESACGRTGGSAIVTIDPKEPRDRLPAKGQDREECREQQRVEEPMLLRLLGTVSRLALLQKKDLSAVASPVHEFPDFGDNDGTFTNRGSNALDRSRPHIVDRKDSRA